MKILILNWRDPQHPLAGGAEISLLEHAKYWQQKGANIIWFSSSSKELKSVEAIDNITYIRRGSHFTVHLRFFLYWMLLKNKKFDVVIDCFHFIPFFTPLFIRNIKIIALINEVAGKLWYANLFYPFAWVGYHAEPYIFHFYNKVPFITGSDSAKKDLLNVGIIKKNIHVIPHGITITNPNNKIKKEKNPTLLYFGRISKDKGIEDVLEAFTIVKANSEEKNSSKLWVVGKEEKEGYLSNMIESKFSEIKKDIIYFGFVDESTKYELMKKSWVLLHASTKEGWGLTVIEAGSQETPTIGYNVEGLRDSIVDNKTGILVEKNPKSMAEAIKKIIRSRELYNLLSMNAYMWSTNFNWKKSGNLSWRVINK